MSAETGAYWALGAVGITGKFLGLPVELLLIGGVVGGAMLGRHRETTRLNGITTILLSAVLSASLAPYLPKMLGFEQDLDVFCAVAVAAVWPWVVLELGPMLKSRLSGSKKP